ncbi:unnamed protein product [Rotaria magnacalcarata]
MVLVYSLLDSILDRFCSHILSKIHQKIKWLDLESLDLFIDGRFNQLHTLSANISFISALPLRINNK